MEDRRGKVCEAVHILGSNPHPESRCLEHSSVSDCGSLGREGRAVRKQPWDKSEWVLLVMKKVAFHSWKAFVLSAPDTSTKIWRHTWQNIWKFPQPDAFKLNNQTALFAILYIKEIKWESRRVLWASTSLKYSAIDESRPIGLWGGCPQIPSRIPARGSQPCRCIQYCLTFSQCTLWKRLLQQWNHIP